MVLESSSPGWAINLRGPCFRVVLPELELVPITHPKKRSYPILMRVLYKVLYSPHWQGRGSNEQGLGSIELESMRLRV